MAYTKGEAMSACKDEFRQMELTWDVEELSSDRLFERSTPEECGRTLTQFNIERGWGFDPEEIMNVVDDMTELGLYDNPLKIIFAQIDLGLTLKETWQELSSCIGIGLENLGCYFSDNINADYLTYLHGKERLVKKGLTAIRIDLSKNHGPKNSGVSIEPNKRWPGIEVMSLILQNLDLYRAMDGRNVPYISVPGLVYKKRNSDGSINESKDSMPCLHCIDGKKASVLLDSHNFDDRIKDFTTMAELII